MMIPDDKYTQAMLDMAARRAVRLGEVERKLRVMREHRAFRQKQQRERRRLFRRDGVALAAIVVSDVALVAGLALWGCV